MLVDASAAKPWFADERKQGGRLNWGHEHVALWDDAHMLLTSPQEGGVLEVGGDTSFGRYTWIIHIGTSAQPAFVSPQSGSVRCWGVL